MAGHAQHPVIVHFPIALFIASAVFDILAIWRKEPVLAAVGYFNLVGAAITVPFAIATGLAAWQWQLEGATLKGNLRLHYDLRADYCGAHCWFFVGNGYDSVQRARSPGASYFVAMALGVMMITLTGHLGGILSGVEAP